MLENQCHLSLKTNSTKIASSRVFSVLFIQIEDFWCALVMQKRTEQTTNVFLDIIIRSFR